MANKLKKSKVKPRSRRSIEMEQKRQEAIEKYEAELEKAQKSRYRTLSVIFFWYSLVASVFSVFLGFWGIFSLMAIGFGIAGLKMNGGKKNKEYWAAVIGIAIGVIWLIVQIVMIFARVN